MPAMLLHAPHLIDAEVGDVLRRHERSGLLSSAEDHAALILSGYIVKRRYPHVGELAQRAWVLRRNLNYYDALYVALASQLDLPLLTADVRLTKSPGLSCAVQLV